MRFSIGHDRRAAIDDFGVGDFGCVDLIVVMMTATIEEYRVTGDEDQIC
jgi:hypothetical protein